VRIDEPGKGPSPSRPSVVFASGHAVVVWTAAATGAQVIGQVWSDVSTDGGRTWGPDVLLHEVAGGGEPRVHLISDGRTARAVFHAGRLQESWAIYYAETDPGGVWRATGEGLPRVSQGEGQFANPRIAADAGGALYVVYEENQKRILLNRSSDGGVTWGPVKQVYEVEKKQGSAVARYPQVSVADGVVYVMWEVWADITGMYKNFADIERKPRPADLYVRRISFAR
jgi:hypothetical protein